MSDREKRLERALQKIVDETPANEHTKWHHHHWYLVTAREALSGEAEGENFGSMKRAMINSGLSGEADVEEEG